ncbi:MAG: DUF1016 N-terminal domain-containing protein [Thermodesulfovibrionales bacterium]
MTMPPKKELPLYDRIRQILESARNNVVRTVNTTQVAANWLIGREIVLEDQSGSKRAKYGSQVLAEISFQLKKEYGGGYSVDNLEVFRRFYLEFPNLISETLYQKSDGTVISETLCRKLPMSVDLPVTQTGYAEYGVLCTNPRNVR